MSFSRNLYRQQSSNCALKICWFMNFPFQMGKRFHFSFQWKDFTRTLASRTMMGEKLVAWREKQKEKLFSTSQWFEKWEKWPGKCFLAKSAYKELASRNNKTINRNWKKWRRKLFTAFPSRFFFHNRNSEGKKKVKSHLAEVDEDLCALHCVFFFMIIEQKII